MVAKVLTNSRSTDARLRFSPEIIRRLGEELNPTLSKGILELAKNSYDADATRCRIELQDINQPGGTVVVEDNGDGMTLDQIAGGWLVLGRSAKKPSYRTRLGRAPAGSKGLGRLAALRMGQSTSLYTVSRQVPDAQRELVIDWNRFDEARTVEDVPLTIGESTGDLISPSGTKIEIRNLRDGYGHTEVKLLARELLLLADPFGDDPDGFQPELIAPDFKDLQRLIKDRYFSDAEFHLSATVNEDGRATAQLKDFNGELVCGAEHKQLVTGGRVRYACPAASLDLWVFILNKETFALRASTLGEIRAWLKEFGGVHIYFNGLRISPYGGPDDDWLGMNLRRARSPEERPSTNTSIGRVLINDEDSRLVEKTDRSGFIENVAFHDLRSFAQDSMEWMARFRLREAEKRRRQKRTVAPRKTGEEKENLTHLIEAVPDDQKREIKSALSRYDSARDRQVKALEKEVQLYRTLSTAGITAATFAHESNANPIKIIWQCLNAIRRRASSQMGPVYSTLLKKPVDAIERAVDSLAVHGHVTLSMLEHQKRRKSRLELNTVLNEVVAAYMPFLHAGDVSIITNLALGIPYLRGRRAALESIVTNLLNNCVAAFEDAGTAGRVIEITTEVSEGEWRLSVSDSGPGIVGIQTKDIWLPGHTTRRNGTGLGLTIVRDSVHDLGGSVDAIAHGPRGGAEIVVKLPIIGS